MKLNIFALPDPRPFRFTALALMLASPLVSSASTVWTGPLTTYTQPAAHNPTVAADQDRLTSRVWLTRASRFPMFNAEVESSYNGSTSPIDTEWAVGSLANYNTLTYKPWAQVIGGDGTGFLASSLPGVQYVCHLKTDDIYLSVKFTSWGGRGAGGFAYQRSTPAVVPPTPTVSLTNPVGSSVFAAPANVKLSASAAVSSGSVTNVSYFSGATLLGSATTAPYNFTASNLTAGPYSLTAVATAAGISATSSVVTISVVSPVAVSLSSPVAASGQFSFNYSANVGLKYVVQSSPDLLTWTSLSTNTAAANPVPYSASLQSSGGLFYRVGLLPNP